MSWLNDFGTWMEKHVVGPVWSFIAPLLKDAVREELAALQPLALSVVAQIAADPSLLTNGAKRDAALRLLGEAAKNASIQVGERRLSQAIELAVESLWPTPEK